MSQLKIVPVYMQLFVPLHNNLLFCVVKDVESLCYLRNAETGAQMYCPPSLFGRNCLRMTVLGADKSLARPGMKQAAATEDFEFHISYL